jgi:hypothetical protein
MECAAAKVSIVVSEVRILSWEIERTKIIIFIYFGLVNEIQLSLWLDVFYLFHLLGILQRNNSKNKCKQSYLCCAEVTNLL